MPLPDTTPADIRAEGRIDKSEMNKDRGGTEYCLTRKTRQSFKLELLVTRRLRIAEMANIMSDTAAEVSLASSAGLNEGYEGKAPLSHRDESNNVLTELTPSQGVGWNPQRSH